MRRRWHLYLLSAALWLGTVAAPGVASAQAQQAKRFLERKHDAVMRVMRQSGQGGQAEARREQRLDRLLAGLLDYRELSKRALGSHWKERSEQEREQFVALLRKLVERSYKQNLQRTLNYEIDYGSAEAQDGTVHVETTARSRENRRAPPVSIDYRLKRSDGSWRVYDVITDGVSMVDNYRNQFSRIIDKEGWDGLIERMEKKLESGG